MSYFDTFVTKPWEYQPYREISQIIFLYDDNSTAYGFIYNGVYYYYTFNLQGDVIGIVDTAGEYVVKYTYDEWGKILSTTDGNGQPISENEESHIANINPLRYRGYYYDTETKFYYLNTRYYDPEVGRFINADVIEVISSTPYALTDKNLFSYCDNNPIIRVDSGGDFWDTVFDVISLVVSVVEVIKDPTDAMAWVGLAGDAIDLVPFVTGVGEVTRTVKFANKSTDVYKVTNKTVNSANDTVKITNKIHGNSLKTTKETYGYALRKNGTNEIMKFGETTRGTKRYTNKFYVEKGVHMDIMVSGSKYDMHLWQHNKIVDYSNRFGVKPPWNKSFW